MIWIALLVLAVVALSRLEKTGRRLALLEERVDRLLAERAPPSQPAVPAAVRAEPEPASAPPAPSLAPPPIPEPAPEPRPAFDLEHLVGRTLPIWVGGAALAIGGFYLVRLAIQAGLLSPPVRVGLAALFGLALIGLGEIAARWRRTADDRRVAQALTGAGIASLYAAAYLSSAVYALASPLAAFLLMAAVTAGALGLSLRLGPPVAIMGLVGGFAAPLLAGGDGAVVPLLVYLGLLVAGLFALAIARSWLWLSLAASAGSILWGAALILTTRGGPAFAAGLFALLVAAAGAAATPASTAGETPRRLALLRALPIAAGLSELALLVARSGLGLEAWGLYLGLSFGAVWLGAREARLVPLVAGALGLALAALAGTALGGAPDAVLLFAAAGIALLFGGAGHVFARESALWAGIGATALLLPPLLLEGARPTLLPRADWAGIDALLALAPLHLAWRSRPRAVAAPPFDASLQIGAGAGAALLVLAIAHLPGVPPADALLLAGLLLAAAARAIGDGGLARQSLAAAGLAILAGGAAARALAGLGWSLAGGHVMLPLLPAPLDALRWLAAPAGLALLVLPGAALGAGLRRAVAVAAGLGVGAGLYVLLKQPFAIRDEAAFVARGFAERALLTEILFAGAAAAWWRGWRRAGLIAGGIALLRLLWFDLLLLDPAFVAQDVGPLPVANLLVLHFALAAGWTALAWTRARRWPLLAALVAIGLGGALLAVRQATHGAIPSGGPVSRGELYGYSIAGLAVAAALLGGGARAADQPMRLAGLGLLTLVVLKVFLVDAAALGGGLRILSFLGLGAALIAIGWAYGRYFGRKAGAG